MLKKLNKNLIVAIAIVIAALLISGTIFYVNQKKEKIAGVLTAQQASQKATDFISKYLVEEGMKVSLEEVSEENGLYKIRFKAEDQEYNSYVTKNGKLLFFNAIDMESIASQFQAQEKEKQEKEKEVLKSEKADVKLFVMSYCPFGLQMEKAFLPVYNLLKDKAEMGIYFVDYIMHEKKEIDENLRQYCIQKEEREKYPNYLECFVKEGDPEKCLGQSGIDKGKMNSCIEKTDKEYKITELYNDKNSWLSGYYPRFNVHKDLNDKYGIQGSPTLVINDQVLNVERSPEKIKEAICQAFLTPPSECQQKLSENVPSPGFGEGEGRSQEGQCK